MLQRLREWLTIMLIAALPFHALLVTVGTKMIAGPGHAPLTYLAMWKEGVLGVILVIAVIEILQSVSLFLSLFLLLWGRNVSASQKQKQNSEDVRVFDWIDGLIVALIILAIAVSAHSSYLRPPEADYGGQAQLAARSFLFGFKYDFIPLISFLILRRVPWSEQFRTRAMHVLLVVGGMVAVYGILTLALPPSLFSWLGYSDLHSLYLPNAPLAAFQQIESLPIHRIQSTMSGPNQLGLWLLIPGSIAFVLSTCDKNFKKWILSWRSVIMTLFGLALVLTFSRAAWVAMIVAAACGVAFAPVTRSLRRWFTALIGLGVVIGLLVLVPRPNAVLRPQSSSDHLRRPLQALQIIAAHPLGIGLGTAGPASNAQSDACVHLPPDGDASWAKDNPELCVFLGDVQVQPFDTVQGTPLPCKCPLLPENWYLQIGVELGVLGLVLYVALTVFSLVKLKAPTFFRLRRTTAGRHCSKLKASPSHSFTSATFLTFLGLSIAALFLHAFEDSAVAYTAWVMIAGCLHFPEAARASRPP